MMRRLVLCLLLCVAATAVHAREKVVTAEYLYQIPANVSQEEARNTALSRAQLQAIADEFGMYVTQSTTVSVQNSADNSTTDYFASGGSEARGEWIETIGEPEYEFVTDGGNVAVRVRVKGRIREIESADLPVEVRILRNGVEDMHESEVFSCGDDMYMSFRSSLNGYIAVYLIDNNNRVFCLLPYSGQQDGLFRTRSNRRYVFFHPDYCEDVKADEVDRLVMDTDCEREHDRILTVFSPNKFYKAVDSRTDEALPRELKLADFQKWLGSMRRRDKDMTVCVKALTIVR